MEHKPPPCPKGCFEWREERLLDVPIVCYFDYEEAQRGVRENGFPLEPDYPAQATLFAAYVRDVDVLELLNKEQIQRIESDALESLEGEWA